MGYDKLFRFSCAMPLMGTNGVDVDFRSDDFPVGEEKALLVSIMRRCADYVEARPDPPNIAKEIVGVAE